MSDPTKERALAKFVAGLAEPKSAAVTERVPALADMCDPLTLELVYSYLLWEAGPTHALEASKRIAEGVVDLNELRICLVDELEELFGPKIPHVGERAARIRLTLNDLYRKQHATSLQGIESMTKRESRAMLESLEGIPSFVASRVFLLGLGGHAFPLDSRLSDALGNAGVIPDGMDLESAAGWLERHIRAGDAVDAYLKFEDWSVSKQGRKLSSSISVRARVKSASSKRSAKSTPKKKTRSKNP